MDTVTGEKRLTPFSSTRIDWSPPRWVGDRLVLPDRYRVQIWHLAEGRPEVRRSRGLVWAGLSPDNRLLAGYDVDPLREDEHNLAPATVVLFDLQTGRERLFPDVALGRVPHTEVPPQLYLTWEPEGTLRIEGFRWNSQTGQEEDTAQRLDPATGRITPINPAEINPVFGPSYGHDWTPGPGGWAYLVQIGDDPGGEYGIITGRSPEGLLYAWGRGQPVDWTPKGELLILRWPNYPHRRNPLED